MSNLSADMGNASVPHTITTDDGKVFKFRHMTASTLGNYQRERFAEERKRLAEFREEYPPGEYIKRLDQIRERFERGEFDFLAEIERQGIRDFDPARMNTSAVVALVIRTLVMMTGEDEDDCWRLFRDRPEESGLMIRQILLESFPKARAGVTPAQSLPPSRPDASIEIAPDDSPGHRRSS